MFAYGTALMVFMERSSDAHWFELALPISCASMSVIVAVLCLRKNATHAIDRSEKLTFGADVLVTIAYLISAAFVSGHKEFVVLFIVAGNITTVTSFAPIVVSTWKEPQREHPLPWAIWTVAYASLFVSTIMAEGASSPELLLYPGLCAVLHGLVSVFSLRAALSSGTLRLPEARIPTLPATAALTATRLSSPSLQPFAARLAQPLRNHMIPNSPGVPNMQQAVPQAMQMSSATLAMPPWDSPTKKRSARLAARSCSTWPPTLRSTASALLGVYGSILSSRWCSSITAANPTVRFVMSAPCLPFEPLPRARRSPWTTPQPRPTLIGQCVVPAVQPSAVPHSRPSKSPSPMPAKLRQLHWLCNRFGVTSTRPSVDQKPPSPSISPTPRPWRTPDRSIRPSNEHLAAAQSIGSLTWL
jgi:hypothetical protein